MEHNNNYGYLTDCREIPITFPPQRQDRQPGFECVISAPDIGMRERLPEAGGQGRADHRRGQRYRQSSGIRLCEAGRGCSHCLL